MEQFPQQEKDPFLNSFDTVHEFEEALLRRSGISFSKIEPVGTVTVGVGTDRRFYLLSLDAGKVMFIKTANSWQEALGDAKDFIGQK